MLTEENLSDPHRRLRSPGHSERKTLATTKANSASPSNDDSSFRTEDEGGTDALEEDSDGGGFGVLSASPLMQEQRLGSKLCGRENEAENRRQVLQLNRSHPKSVFNLSAIANSLDDMTPAWMQHLVLVKKKTPMNCTGSQWGSRPPPTQEEVNTP